LLVLKIHNMEKENKKISIRSDLDEESSKELLEIKKWLGTKYITEAVKFCIRQTYVALKRGKIQLPKIDDN